MELCTQDDHTWLYTDDAKIREQAWRLAYSLGARHVRFVIYESYVARLGWGFVQRAVIEGLEHGLEPQVVLTGPPRWDPNGQRLGYADPRPAKFARWVREATEALPAVKRWSLWNEPNLPQFLVGSAITHKAALYAKLYEAGYRALRDEAPLAEVLFGELSGGLFAPVFLRNAAQGFECHGFAVHPYQFEHEPHVDRSRDPHTSYPFNRLPRLEDDLFELAKAGKLVVADRHPRTPITPRVYMTEFGYPAHGWPHAKPEGERAKWTTDAYRMGRVWGLAQFCYYHLVTSPPGTAWNTGIVNIGSRGYSMSPTYLRLRRATHPGR